MTGPAATRPIDALAATYWDAFLEANPLFATTLGDARFDDRLPDPTPEGQAAVRARYAAILAQAEALDAGDLDAGEGEGAAAMPSRSPPSARGCVPTSRSSTAGCSPGTWIRSTGSRSTCSRPASTSGRRPRPGGRACSSAGARCPPTRTRTPRPCGDPSRMASWPAALPWIAWRTSWPSCWRARTRTGRSWPRSRAGTRAPGPRAPGRRRLDHRGARAVRDRPAGRRRRRDPAGLRPPPRRPRDRDPPGRAPGGPARPVPPARRRGGLPEPGPGPHLAGR